MTLELVWLSDIGCDVDASGLMAQGSLGRYKRNISLKDFNCGVLT